MPDEGMIYGSQEAQDKLTPRNCNPENLREWGKQYKLKPGADEDIFTWLKWQFDRGQDQMTPMINSFYPDDYVLPFHEIQPWNEDDLNKYVDSGFLTDLYAPAAPYPDPHCECKIPIPVWNIPDINPITANDGALVGSFFGVGQEVTMPYTDVDLGIVWIPEIDTSPDPADWLKLIWYIDSFRD